MNLDMHNLDTSGDARKLHTEMQADAETISNAAQFARNAVYVVYSKLLESGVKPAWVDVSETFDTAFNVGKSMENRIRHEMQLLAASYEERVEALSRRAQLGIASKGPIVTSPH